MPLQPSRRDILSPPPVGVSDLAKVGRRHESYLRSLDPGILGGRFATLRPVGVGASDLVGDDSGSDGEADPQWEDGDRLTVTATGRQVWRLSHEPLEESLFVRWHPRGLTRAGIPWPNENWLLDEQTVVISDTAGLLEVGDAFSCQYQYLDGLEEPAAFVGATSVAGDHSSIPIPAGTQPGDMLVLVMCGRATATCSDPRMTSAFIANVGGGAPGGVWVGTADGSGLPVAISLISSGVGDGADGAAALMSITGDVLSLAADQTSTTSTIPFTPGVPGGSANFGMVAVFGMSGIASGSISESTALWTLRKVQGGGGAAKCSVYLGTAEGGIPSGGTWTCGGSTINGGARVMGV